jgi:hypothetical protein
MKKLFFYLICILCLNNLSAQREGYNYGIIWNINEGGKFYVYSDIANVRAMPDQKSDIVSKVTAGQEIEVLATEDDYDKNLIVIDGFWGKWVPVKINENISGWLWSNMLSYKQLRRGNTKFVFGIDKVIENGYKCSVKVIEDGKIIDRKTFEIGFEQTNGTSASIIDNVLLENVKFVVRLYMGGEACAIPLNEIYFAWLDEKTKLVELPQTFSVSDACVMSYVESLYIPTESNSGIYNLLLKVSQAGIPPQESDLDCDLDKWGWEYKTEFFKWNGEKVVKIKN